MLYTSIKNDKIKYIKKLQEKKYRDLANKFFIEGEHLVMEAYNKGLLEMLILEDGMEFKIGVDVMYVSSNVIKYLSELDNPNKVMGICRKKDNQITGNHLLILDNIQDPGNLGTIIRSAVAFNVSTIILSNDTVDVYNAKVLRASQGMIFNTNIMVCDIKKTIIDLKEKGYQIYGTKVTDGIDVSRIDKDIRWAVVVGNEGKGVSEEILKLCDQYIYINMHDNCESLNVAVATSIILYELDKR